MPYIIASFPTGSFPTNTWPDFTWPEGGVSVDIQYTEVMAFTVKAFVTAALSVELPNETSIDAAVSGMAVSGAGSSAVNGEYADDGIYHSDTVGDGKRYKLIGAEMYLLKVGQIWVFSQSGGSDETWVQVMSQTIYLSEDRDKESPDLVSTWTISSLGSAPAPTVAIPTLPTLGALVPLTLESPQLVPLTLYKELSK